MATAGVTACDTLRGPTRREGDGAASMTVSKTPDWAGLCPEPPEVHHEPRLVDTGSCCPGHSMWSNRLFSDSASVG